MRIAIIGLGLMGGSLGLALRRGKKAVVHGYARRAATRRLALKLGAVDQVFDRPVNAVRNADLVVICTPVLSIPGLARSCAPALGSGAVITDVGSTKGQLISAMSSLRVTFIGSHPIAGSELAGLDSARADLYEDAVVVLTPAPGIDRKLVGRLARFWKSVGAEPVVMTAREHDALVARTSHLPHLLAAILVGHVAGSSDSRVRRLCGGGFRDVSRIADGSPEMWHDIVASNSTAVLRELRGYRRLLDRVQKMIARKDFAAVRRFLDKSRRQRGLLVR